MKFITFLTFFAMLLTAATVAQTPAIEWQKCFGGSDRDFGSAIEQIVDGGYILAGNTRSNNGTRLKKYGLTFHNAFTNSCMCSPAWATFMTGYLPAQHGVKYTLEART